MAEVDRWHLGAGLAAAALGALSWLFGWNGCSAVTLSTVGYGDFAPTSSKARLLVLWELRTGMLMLLGVFPLIVGRISDF